ncbi:MAG: hypothetical protein AAF512_13940, partial [Pseudomonadota bacterium]
MVYLRKVLFIFFTLLFLASREVASCSVAGNMPSRLGEWPLHIFTGQVIGFVKTTVPPLDPKHHRIKDNKEEYGYWGIRIAANERISLPTESRIYDVYKYGLYSDCSYGFSPHNLWLKKQYPLGSQLKVVATLAYDPSKSKITKLVSDGSDIRIAKKSLPEIKEHPFSIKADKKQYVLLEPIRFHIKFKNELVYPLSEIPAKIEFFKVNADGTEEEFKPASP